MNIEQGVNRVERRGVRDPVLLRSAVTYKISKTVILIFEIPILQTSGFFLATPVIRLPILHRDSVAVITDKVPLKYNSEKYYENLMQQ